MRRALFALALAAALLEAAPGLAANTFYTERLREGSLALERGEAARAAKDLRIACFGLLDDTRLLAECLTRLALAEDKQGNLESFREVYRRLAEVEERFGGYSQSALPAEVKAQLERRAAAVLPAALLQQSPPTLRLLAGNRDGGPAAAAPGTSATVTRPRPAGGAPAPAAPAVAPPAAAAPPAGAAPPARTLSQQERSQLDEVRRILAQQADGRALSSAFELARGVADAHPSSTEAQHLAAEAAYRIKRFKEAALYFQRGGDPGDAAAELLFYQAVAFFETGSRDEAASALRRALPNLRRTPYVDGYAKRILGQ